MRSFAWRVLRGGAGGRAGAYRALGLVAVVGLAGAAGCRSAVADFYEDLVDGSGGTGGGTGGTGGLPLECQGDPTKDPALVRDECGVFVDAAAAPAGNGTKASPFTTLSEAAKSGKGRIFVCAGIYAEEATVSLSGGVSIFGGFEACPPSGDWTWSSEKRASIQGPADSPVMKLAMGESHLEGLDLLAADAVSPGASSVALVADGAAVDLVDVDLLAGLGAAGKSGITPPDPPAEGASADAASPTDACVMDTIMGGKGALTMCADGPSQGGDGGKGGTVPANNGEAGKDGTPLPDPNPDGSGLGGTVDALSGNCSPGQPGAEGMNGASGAAGTEKGTLAETGIVGGDGEDGKLGAPGQGGGGGGGSRAGVFCGNPAVQGAGASGGGGGAGGCGGKGGPGGKAGGSSVGILSIGSSFTFSGVVVRTSAGGKGGTGALGQGGAVDGQGAPGGTKAGGTSKTGCNGGFGGSGGNGGGGGGGRGGHSVGIAFGEGSAPAVETGISFEIGAAGDGGIGGNTPDNDGAPGTAEALVDFGSP